MKSQKSGLAIAISLGFMLILTVLVSTPLKIHSAPNVIYVNSTDDPGDGDCTPTNCTLREAITAAVSGDTINFDASIHGDTILLGSELVIDKDITIDHKDKDTYMTVSGGDSTRLFSVNYNKSLTLKKLILLDGLGASSGGAIYNYMGDVTVERCRFEGNNAQVSGFGGALYNYENGTMVVDQSTFINNSAKRGGAIWNFGSLTVTDSTFENNDAEERGGGIYNNLNADGLSIENSTFIGNTTTTYGGGGIFNEAQNKMYITNSTFYGNFAGGSGGGLYSYSFTESVITNCTFFDNGGSISGEGGGVNIFNGTLWLVNTIIANSTGGYDCYQDSQGTPSEYNLIMNNAPDPYNCGNPILTSAPMLVDPPALNGGLTKTMALYSSSPAIDVGNANHCPDTDQRGFPRPQGGGCDLGAYELDSYPTVMSIETADPNPTSESYLDFTVKFNEPVTNVDASDFSPVTTGTITSANVTNVTNVANVDGVDVIYDDSYMVTVRIGLGTGTLRLDLIDNNSIEDSAPYSLGGREEGDGDFYYGEVYFIRYNFIYLPLILK